MVEGKEFFSSAFRVGQELKKTLENDPNFYFFSPDETTSNKLHSVFEVAQRSWGDLLLKDGDLPSSHQGRIIELLSENVLFAAMLGHLSNQKQAYFASYEAFLEIISSQILQHLKFLKQSSLISWRDPFPATNILSTSTCWRQDHNGFTHQSPALISSLLNIPTSHFNAFFPVDDNTSAVVFHHTLKLKNVVNLTTLNKTPEPRWQSVSSAQKQLDNSGLTVFDFASDKTPEIILVGIGDIATKEIVYATKILKQDLPKLKIRVINLLSLSYRSIGPSDNPLSSADFTHYFKQNIPIIINFHGYPDTVKSIFANYTNPNRLHLHGFQEEGSTTTPFEMLAKNQASRYNLAISVARLKNRPELIQKYQQAIKNNHAYAISFGTDLPDITNFTF